MTGAPSTPLPDVIGAVDRAYAIAAIRVLDLVVGHANRTDTADQCVALIAWVRPSIEAAHAASERPNGTVRVFLAATAAEGFNSFTLYARWYGTPGERRVSGVNPQHALTPPKFFDPTTWIGVPR
jgi:hypothetical protein